MVVAKSAKYQIGARWLPLLSWMAVIFLVSDQPARAIPALGFWDLVVKKSAHFLVYAFLAFLSWRLVENAPHPYLWAFVITAVYAGSDEWHQAFVPTRNGTLLDFLIDCAGAAVALLALHYRRRPPVARAR